MRGFKYKWTHHEKKKIESFERSAAQLTDAGRILAGKSQYQERSPPRTCESKHITPASVAIQETLLLEQVRLLGWFGFDHQPVVVFSTVRRTERTQCGRTGKSCIERSQATRASAQRSAAKM